MLLLLLLLLLLLMMMMTMTMMMTMIVLMTSVIQVWLHKPVYVESKQLTFKVSSLLAFILDTNTWQTYLFSL